MNVSIEVLFYALQALCLAGVMPYRRYACKAYMLSSACYKWYG